MKSKLGILALIAGITFTATVPAGAQAQRGRNVSSRATQSRGTGTDANIKSDDVKNVRGRTMAAPAAKGGVKTRGAAVGVLHVDNRTGLYVRIYVDGDYRGTIAPFGDWYANGDCESFNLYGVAQYDDGSHTTFGPVTTGSSCSSATWTLRQ